MKKLFFYLLFAASVIAQQTVPNFAVKTNLTLAGKTVTISASSLSSLLSTSSGIVDGAIATVAGDNGSSSIWTWSASSTAAPNVDVIGSGTGRWIRNRQEVTPLRQTGYSIYEPTVTRNYVLNQATSGYQYNHDSSLAYYGGTWFAQWNANTNQYESNPGQVNLQSTSTDFVTWTTPVPVFVDASTSSNPVTYSYSTDLQWQPNLVNVGSELWSVWMQEVPATYPSGQKIYFSRLSSVSGKWTNNLLSLNYTENGMTFYGFPTQNPIQLQSGRVLAPLVWMATNAVSPIPAGWTSSDTFWIIEKRAGVIYTDDGGYTWKIGGTTTLPGANYVCWEPVIQQAPDGSIRMYCRNLDYKNYGSSQYLLTAAGFSDGLVFGPLQFVSVDTSSSRYGLAAQSGKYPREIGFANDWKASFNNDRYNGSLTFSRYGIEDFVFGVPFSGQELFVSYPQGHVASDAVRVIYSQGSVPRSIKTAQITPAPDPEKLYLLPRRNDYVNPLVAFISGPPAYFMHTLDSSMSSVQTSATWASTNQFSFGAWLFRTNNPSFECIADFRSVTGSQGAAVVIVSGVPRLVFYSGVDIPLNVDFSSLSVPTNSWCYIGASVDVAASSATFYVVNSSGTATTQTVAVSSANGLNGSVLYVGRSRPGSTIASYSGAIRHVIVQNGVVATANNHRYWHGLDQSALSVSDWSGTETSPGTASMDYWAADPNAGSNNAAWLANWSATGQSIRGNAYGATVGSDSVLTVTGTGSAGVEVFPFTPGQQLVFGTQVLLTNKTSGYDQVIATIGGKTNRIDIVSRNANSTRIEAYSADTGAYYDLCAYVSGQYIPVTMVFDGKDCFVSVNNGAEARIPVSFKSPRIYLGTGYLDVWTIDSGDGRNYKLAATYCHVGTAVPLVSNAINVPNQSIISTQPSIALIDTDSPAKTNFLYALGSNVRIGQTNQSSTAAFTLAVATGNLTASGEITSTKEFVKNYGASPDINFRRFNGTSASPSAVASGDAVGAVFASGYDGTSEVAGKGALVFEATQTWSSGANGTRAYIQTTPNGSSTRSMVWEWGQDGNVLITNTAPIIKMGAANGSSGGRIQVFGHFGSFFRVLDEGSSTRFAIEPSTWNVIVYGSKVTLGGTSGPTITTGSGAPSASEPNGSIYLRTGGSPYFYVREGGAWVGK